MSIFHNLIVVNLFDFSLPFFLPSRTFLSNRDASRPRVYPSEAGGRRGKGESEKEKETDNVFQAIDVSSVVQTALYNRTNQADPGLDGAGGMFGV